MDGATAGRQLWTTHEVGALRVVAPLGTGAAALLLRRSPESIRRQAKRARPRISLRRRETRLEPDRIAELLRLVGSGAPLCPRCSRAPIEDTRLGWCRACSLEELAAVHAAAVTEIEAERELDMQRQRKHRSRLREARIRRSLAAAVLARGARIAYFRNLTRWEHDQTDLRPRPTLATWEARFADWLHVDR